jgi:opacity protein-like surface antigen
MLDMFKKVLMSATLVALAAPVSIPAPAFAQTHTYHGRTHHYRYRCKRSKGTTGLLAGAGGGGLGAAALGAGPVGLAAGVIGGGLLGRHLDKKHDAAQNRRNGC